MAVATHTVPRAWVELLRAQAAARRRMDARLLAEHGLTLSDYEVMLRLYGAPENRMRRVDLSGSVLLSPSGITRLLKGLEEAGFVSKASCSNDARIVYAELTSEGKRKFRAAAKTHLEDIEEVFTQHFTDDEMVTLAELLARVGEGEQPCSAEMPASE